MNSLLILAAGLLVVFLLARGNAAIRIRELRKKGIYPQPGQATDSDVRRLVKSGHKVEAVRCYREIHRSSLKTAKEAVERMEV